MSFDWTLGKKLALGFSIAGLTLLVVAYFGYESTHHLIENDRWVGHTYQVRAQVQTFTSAIAEAEAGVRGYALTGDDRFLDHYRGVSDRIDALVDEVERLTADNPDQQRRIEILRPLLVTRVAQMKELIDQRRSSGIESTIKVVATGDVERTSERVVQLIGEMDRQERDLLDKRRDEAEASAEGAKAVILWGTILGFFLIVVAGTLITRSLNQQIGNAAQHMQSSSTELQTASTQQATGAREQATAMAEITTTITELLASARQITDGAQRVAQIAEQTATAARAGDTTVERGQESISAIRRQVDLIVSHMLELGKKSQQIGLVVEVVAELAEQTNILAINATIEAVGAGEAGKRFGVVADEVRKLADRVAGSTKEIRGLVDDVRSAVNTTIMTTETGSKAVEAGSKQFSDVAAAFKQIVGQVVTATEASREIGLSTKQQATAVEQVNIAITNVAQAARENEVSTGQTAQTATQLASLSRALLRLVRSDVPGATRAQV